MLKRSGIKLFALCLGLLLLVTACGGTTDTAGGEDKPGEKPEEKPVETKVLRAGLTVETTNNWYLALEDFGKQLETLSEGKYSLQIYPQGQLGNEKEMVQQLSDGILDIAGSSIANLALTEEAFGVWFVPYLINDMDMAYAASQTQEAKALLDSLEKIGIHGLGYLPNEMRQVLGVKPLTTPEDFKNTKIRITPSPAVTAWYNTLGASPTPIALPEVYPALQTGVVSAEDQNLTAILTGRHYEVVKELSLTNHFAWTNTLLINKELWDSLSEEEKGMFNQAMEFAQEANITRVKEAEKKNIEELQSYGVNINEVDTAAFEQVAQKLFDEYKAKGEPYASFIDTVQSLKK